MIILASASPRRKELLKQIVDDFVIEVKDIDEKANRPKDAKEIPYELAYRKAKGVSVNHYNDIVIGCDTVVVYNNEVLEKPIDELDAYNMLMKLNNNTHKVISGVAILHQDQEIRFIEETIVTFNNLKEEEIKYYISTKDPMDKAGAYGIQNPYVSLVKSLNGEYENVVGLPIKRLKEELKKIRT